MLLEHFCLTSATVIGVAGHGLLALLDSVRSVSVTGEDAVLVGWWTSDVSRGVE